MTYHISKGDWLRLIHHRLKNESDRRGPIATLEFEEVPNQSYTEFCSVNFVRQITSLLSGHYVFQNTADYNGSEFNESWITFRHDENSVVIWHKYWTEKQIDAFREILNSLAKLYDVEILDDRETK